MAEQKRAKRNQAQAAETGTDQNGHREDGATYEQELAAYLQERIKPGLNSGAIPLLARSIAKEIARREHPAGESQDAEDEPSGNAEDEPAAEAEDEPAAEAEDEPAAEAEDEPTAEGDDEPTADADEESSEDEPSAEADDESGAEDESPDFEADMHDLQAELGEDWILSFSVLGDDAWLTAQKADGSQRLEAPTASVLSEAVGLLNEAGGRSS